SQIIDSRFFDERRPGSKHPVPIPKDLLAAIWPITGLFYNSPIIKEQRRFERSKLAGVLWRRVEKGRKPVSESAQLWLRGLGMAKRKERKDKNQQQQQFAGNQSQARQVRWAQAAVLPLFDIVRRHSRFG